MIKKYFLALITILLLSSFSINALGSPQNQLTKGIVGINNKTAEISNLGLIYNGYLRITYVKEFIESGIGIVAVNKRSDGTVLKETKLIIKKGSKVIYKINKSVKTCTLIIKDLKNLHQMKKYLIKNYKVPSNLLKGKYIYIFYINWKNGHAIYEQPIEIR